MQVEFHVGGRNGENFKQLYIMWGRLLELMHHILPAAHLYLKKHFCI